MTKNESDFILQKAKQLKALNILGNKCSVCGETNHHILCFHHIDQSKKTKGLSYMFCDSSWSLIEEEIKNCVLLCHNCHLNIHYNTNSPIQKNRIISKKVMLEFKNKFACERCGYDKCNGALTFHHLKDKKFSLATNVRYLKSIQDINEEIENELNKCSVLCFNCHTLEHADVERYNKYKTFIIEKSESLRDKYKEIDIEKMLELKQKGYKNFEIAYEMGCCRGSITYQLRRCEGKSAKESRGNNQTYPNKKERDGSYSIIPLTEASISLL